MRILITGGAGFIGSHLAEHHLKKGDSVWVVDNLSTGRPENIDPLRSLPDFRFDQQDLLNWPKLKEAIVWAEGVYHLAAVVGQEVVIRHPVSVISSNIQGCERLLNTIASSNPDCKALIASSSEVYGSLGDSTFREDARISFPSGECLQVNYPLSKLVDEAMALSYAEERQLKCVIVRLFNTTGPNQTGRYGMVVPRFVSQALKGAPITVFGDGNQTRSFCDIRDVVSQLETFIKNQINGGEIFNLGNDREISINDLALLVKERCRSKSPIVHVPYNEAYGMPFQDVVRRCPDLTKIRARYGFEPKWTLEQTIDWMKSFLEASEKECCQ